MWLERAENHRDLALFNLAIDSRLRGSDLVKMKVLDVMASGQIKECTSVLQSKTQKPVCFEISEGTGASRASWTRSRRCRVPDMTNPDHMRAFFRRAAGVVAFVALLWAIHVINWIIGYGWNPAFGLIP